MNKKLIPYEKLDEDELEYNMSSNKRRSRGLVFIINNYNFSGTRLPNRHFSGLDRDAMFGALRFVGFKAQHITIQENLTALEMYRATCAMADLDYKTQGCLFIVVLTYGSEKLLYGVDAQRISYEKLLEPLRKSSHHKLRNKPKIFIVQADPVDFRATNFPYDMWGVKPQHAPILDENVHRSKPQDNFLFRDVVQRQPVPLPGMYEQKDFLIAYSVLPSTDSGSLFIQAFARVMKCSGRRDDATHLLSCAIREISYLPKTSLPQKSFPYPCVISQLTKILYFC